MLLFFSFNRNPNDGVGPIASGSIAAEANKQDKSKSRVDWPPYDQTHRKYLSLGKFFVHFSFSLLIFFQRTKNRGRKAFKNRKLYPWLKDSPLFGFPVLVCIECHDNVIGWKRKPYFCFLFVSLSLFSVRLHIHHAPKEILFEETF